MLDEISADMEANPPLPQDTAAVDAMASVGIAAGRGPVHTTVDARLTAYRVGLALGSRLIAQSEDAVVRTTATGWHTHEVAGSFGTDYTDRAAVARFGLGQQVPSQAVYLSATTAESGTKLDGERTFTLTFPKGKLPPLGKDGFWSITMYDNNEHLVANPIKRYSIGSHSSGLVATANGAIEIVMSATKPAGRDVNWLPAPGAAFEIVLRVYSPGSAVIDGKWTPPAVQLYKH